MTHSPPFIGSIDQGTSSTRFILFDKNGKIVLSHQVEFEQKYPQPGYAFILIQNKYHTKKTQSHWIKHRWVEQDPLLILNTVRTCVDEVYKQFEAKKIGTKEGINMH